VTLFDGEEIVRWSKEVAAAISQGFSPPQIREKFDLSVGELEEIFDTEIFEFELKRLGEGTFEAWLDTRSEYRTDSVRRKISEKLDDYYDELDKLAMSGALKPEKRADILLSLVKIAAPPDEGQGSVVRMPPAMIDNWARRHFEYESAEAEAEADQESERGSAQTGSTKEGED
jgi:hypothetical protein